METEGIIFNILQTPYTPLAIQDDIAYQQVILDGGHFVLLTVNGCTHVDEFARYVTTRYFIPSEVVKEAFLAMSEVTTDIYLDGLHRVWGLLEFRDGDEITSFATVAYSEKELKYKVELFCEGLRVFKQKLICFLEREWRPSSITMTV